MSRSLVVKVICGTDDPERCNQGFMVAATAATAGVDVSLWLAGEAAWFALPGKAATLSLRGATPLTQLLDLVLASGQVTVCSQCAERREIGSHAVLPGVRVAGAATFTEEVLADGVQALVY